MCSSDLGAAGQTADTAAYRGVASSARLINLRVLDGTGAGQASDVIDAIDWAVDHREQFNIKVINLSLGAAVGAGVTIGAGVGVLVAKPPTPRTIPFSRITTKTRMEAITNPLDALSVTWIAPSPPRSC